MHYGLHIGRPVGFALECPDIGTDLMLLGYDIGWGNALAHCTGQPMIRLTGTHRARERIATARNNIVEDARHAKATHLLMLDPDMAINTYLHGGREPWAKPWFPQFWQFAMEHPCSVLAAPACGRGFDCPVQVFRGNTDEARRKRVSWDDAAQCRGWEKVAAVGTALVLIDMAVFDRIERPYFFDHHTDETYTRLDYTSDIWFCKRCAEAAVPVYVNWDCWIGHWQNQIVPCPRSIQGERWPDGRTDKGRLGAQSAAVPENTVCDTAGSCGHGRQD